MGLFAVASAAAQGPGEAGGFLRGYGNAAAALHAGVPSFWYPGYEAALLNPAALPRLSAPVAGMAYSELGYPHSALQLAYATPLGRFGAASASVSSYSVSEIDLRNATGEPLGTGTSRDFAASVSAATRLGNGSLGASAKYLRYDVTNSEVTLHGYALDIGATIEFVDRLLLFTQIENLAGEIGGSASGGIADYLPWRAVLGASLLHPLGSNRPSIRVGPTGLPIPAHQAPATYVALSTQTELGRDDDRINLAVAVESVPIQAMAEAGIGLRAGLDSRGDFSFGFTADVPLDLGIRPQIDLVLRNDHSLGTLTWHFGLGTTF